MLSNIHRGVIELVGNRRLSVAGASLDVCSWTQRGHKMVLHRESALPPIADMEAHRLECLLLAKTGH